jgi:hypothetical protein
MGEILFRISWFLIFTLREVQQGVTVPLDALPFLAQARGLGCSPFMATGCKRVVLRHSIRLHSREQAQSHLWVR